MTSAHRAAAVGAVLLEPVVWVLGLPGLSQTLHRWWGWLFRHRVRLLAPEEIEASRRVHVSGQIPYDAVLIHRHSPIARLAGAVRGVPTAVTTMRILHFPTDEVQLPVLVHELTHVAQHERVGPIYMARALGAQADPAGYDYGDLAAARAAGRSFADFNPEQQAQICEDYYLVLTGRDNRLGASLDLLQVFVDQMRADIRRP